MLPATGIRSSDYYPGVHSWPADIIQAAEHVTDCYNRALNRSIDQAVFVLGDFNCCDITGVLSNLHQSVTCPMRLNKTIDPCFSNIPAHSDHCVEPR